MKKTALAAGIALVGLLAAQEKLVEKPPVIGDTQQLELARLNIKLLQFSMEQKALEEHQKELESTRLAVVQSLAKACGDKYTPQMNGESAVCVVKTVDPKTAKAAPANPPK